MNIHDRLRDIAEAVEKGTATKRKHTKDLADHAKGDKMPLFWKSEHSVRYIEICDRYIEYWSRKYNDLLMQIPMVQLAVSLLERTVSKVPGHQMQIIDFLSTVKPEKS